MPYSFGLVIFMPIFPLLTAEELMVSPEDTEKADMRIVQAAAEEVRPALSVVLSCYYVVLLV